MCTTKFIAVVVILTVLVLCIGVKSAPAPTPGFLGGYHHLPAATSYSSRIDIHGPEYVKTYAAATPVIKTVVAAPIIKTVLPAVSYHDPWYDGYGYGSGLGHHSYGLGHGYGLDHHGYGLGYGYGIGHHY